MKKVVDFFKRSAAVLISNGIPDSAAELSYYLLFSFFPILLTVNSVLGLFRINVGNLSFLELLVPHAVLNFITDYTERSFGGGSMWFLFLGVYLSLWSGSKYIASLLQKLKSISGAENEGSLIRERLYAVLYATIFLVLSIVSIMFSVAGHQFFNYIMEKLSLDGSFPDMWLTLRFIIIGAVAYFAAVGILRLSTSRHNRSMCYPGAIAVTVLWVVCSLAFSFYIDRIADFSVIYGSIATVIVLLLWLYITNTVILLGGTVNRVLGDMRNSE